MAAVARPLSPRARSLLLALNRGILRVARRWLLLTNLLSAALAGLPLLSAWLAAADLGGPARLIVLLYSTVCHQRPDRSFYPWGAQMATCQRMTAIYAALLLFGLLFALVRRRLRPLGPFGFALLIAPMLLDGLTQWAGWRESIAELRLLTGTLFALASVWLIYPRLDVGFREMVAILEARFRRLGLRP